MGGDGGGRDSSTFTTDSGVSTLGSTATNDETGNSSNSSNSGNEAPGDGDGDPGDGDGDGDGGQDDGPLFDISPQEAGDDGIPMDDQCAKVDILYIIDNFVPVE